MKRNPDVSLAGQPYPVPRALESDDELCVVCFNSVRDHWRGRACSKRERSPDHCVPEQDVKRLDPSDGQEVKVMSIDRCDSEVFSDGDPVCMLDARSVQAEEWVGKVRADSGQRVDWSYFAGRAVVKYIGNREAVVESINKLLPELDGEFLALLNDDGAIIPFLRV